MASQIERMLMENEVAELLNMSPKTLQAWRSKGTGPQFSKLGRHVRYAPRDLQKFLAANQKVKK